MHPDNARCLTAAEIDGCTLANNHVLDWGYEGLAETVRVLQQEGMHTAGAGEDVEVASSPAIFEVSPGARVIVFAYGHESSGVPPIWAAQKDQPGVNVLPDFSEETIKAVRDRVEEVKQPGDIVVFSVHWGSNWGYRIPESHRSFAHALIDTAGVDLIHGHSSHHALGIEVYREKLILYGCGDFLNDYEGIGGYEQYRDDLPLMYLPELDTRDGSLVSLRLIPFHIENFSLKQASQEDTAWMEKTLDREGKPLGTSVSRSESGSLLLEW
jgi:poly-gamma-glutamate synthesis protein (capsule biosynthesis protein)